MLSASAKCVDLLAATCHGFSLYASCDSFCISWRQTCLSWAWQPAISQLYSLLLFFFFFAQDSSIYFAIFSLLIFNKPASGAHCGISATTSSCHPAKSSAYPGFINCPKCLSPLLWRRVLFLGISTASWLSVYSICFSGFGYQAIFTHFLMIIFVIFKFSLEEIQFWTYGWTVITGRLLNLL